MSLATVDSSARAVPREREANDYYREPAWSVLGLLDVQRFSGTVWDPACGSGTIPRTFREAGHRATIGSDLVARAPGFGVANFLADGGNTADTVDNIVCNPPFALAEPFLKRALQLATHKVALLLRLSWLEGQGRRWIFDTTPLAAIHPFASRVSMPPGSTHDVAKGGAVAFMWAVWSHDHPVGAPPALRRIERKPA